MWQISVQYLTISDPGKCQMSKTWFSLLTNYSFISPLQNNGKLLEYHWDLVMKIQYSFHPMHQVTFAQDMCNSRRKLLSMQLMASAFPTSSAVISLKLARGLYSLNPGGVLEFITGG